MRWISLIFVGSLAACAINSQNAKGIRDVEILEAGIYALPPASHSMPVGQCDALSEPDRADVNISATEQTNRIPAKLGTAFGVKFRPVGNVPNDVSTFRVLWRAPDPGILDPATGKHTRDDGCA